MYKQYSRKNLDVKADGKIYALGKIIFDPNNDKGLTWWAATMFEAAFVGGSPAAVDVALADLLTVYKSPFVQELPQAFFDVMAADPSGPLAEDYRGYIRHEIKPAFDRIRDILSAHVAAMEIPSTEWLIETFPGHNKTDSTTGIIDLAVCYVRAWDRILAEWDAGKLEVLFPASHMMPLVALAKLNTWSREQGEAKQHELIGMSSKRKSEASKWMAALEEHG